MSRVHVTLKQNTFFFTNIRSVERDRHHATRASLRLERTMNLLEGGKGGEGRMGERAWGGEGEGRGGEGEGRGGEGREGRGGEGRGGEGRGGEGRDDGYTYCNRYVH